MTKVKWVKVNKGIVEAPEVRYRLVREKLRFGERLGVQFAGASCVMVVKMLTHKVVRKSDRMGLTLLDMNCAFLYGSMRMRVYIELPEQDSVLRRKQKKGPLVKEMYGTRDAHQVG